MGIARKAVLFGAVNWAGYRRPVLSTPVLPILLGVAIAVFGLIVALKASSIADTMWTRNESLTRHSRLLAAPRSYYLWLCRIGGVVLSAGGAALGIGGVTNLLT